MRRVVHIDMEPRERTSLPTPRRPRILAVVVLGIAVALLAALWAAPPVRAHHRPPPQRCVLTTTHKAAAIVLTGESIQAELHLRAACRSPALRTLVSMVVDDPDTFAGSQRELVRDALKALIRYSGSDPYFLIGIAGHGGAIACGVSSLASSSNRCVNRALQGTPRGGGGLAASVVAGRRILTNGHNHGPATAIDRAVLIVFTSCGDEGACRAAAREAEDAKKDDVLVIAVGADARMNTRALRDMATSPRYIFLGHQWPALFVVFDRIRGGEVVAAFDTETKDIINVDLRRVTLTYPMPQWGDYVHDSLAWSQEHGAGSYDPAERMLTWSTVHVPGEGVTVTFQIEATMPGAHQTGVDASWSAEDNMRGLYEERVTPRPVSAFGTP